MLNLKNKRGAFADLFIFMILAFITIFICVVIIFITGQTKDQLHDTLGTMDLHDTQGQNASEVIDDTFGDLLISFQIQEIIALELYSLPYYLPPPLNHPPLFLLAIANAVSVSSPLSISF